MGSHAKPRTTGRKTALGALALGATLTGVGLTAAALDPATAVLTASGPDQDGATQLSGLSTPVSLDLSPTADSIRNLTAAPLEPATSVVGDAASSGGTANGAPGAVDSAGSVVESVTSNAASTGTENSIKPIVASTPGGSGTSSGISGSSSSGSTPGSTGSGSTGSGSTDKTTQPRSAAPPAADTALSSAASSATGTVTNTVASTASEVLPTVQSVTGDVPVVSSATDAVGSLPVVGPLLGGSGDGQSTVTVPGVSTLAGLL